MLQVILTQEEYENLQKKNIFLNCLNQAGVDNWEGWNIAIDLWIEKMGDENVPI